MERRSMWVRYEDERKGWRIYWSGGLEPADERVFTSLENAGAVMRELMGEVEPRPAIARVK